MWRLDENVGITVIYCKWYCCWQVLASPLQWGSGGGQWRWAVQQVWSPIFAMAALFYSPVDFTDASDLNQTVVKFIGWSIESDKITLLKIKCNQENCQQKDTPLILKQMSRRMIDSPRCCFIPFIGWKFDVSMHTSVRCIGEINRWIKQRSLSRYCFYSVVQKWVRPARATRCPDKREIWHGGAHLRSAPLCQISRLSGQKCGNTAPKIVKISNFSHKFLSQGRFVCTIFTKFTAFVDVYR